MRKSRFLFTSLILCIFCTVASAQGYSYIELSPSDGFPSKVTAIYVPKSDFALIGSDDGLYILSNNNSVRHADAGLLPDSPVIAINGDRSGIIWVLTEKGFKGIKDFSGSGASSTIPGPDGVVAYSVLTIGNCVYFGCVNQVIKYDPASGEFSPFISFNTDKPFYINQMMIGSGNGGNDLLLFNHNGEKYFIYNLADGVIRPSACNWRPSLFVGFSDSGGLLWLSDFDRGIVSIGSDGKETNRFNTANSALNCNTILCFAEINGELWLGTAGGGINILDTATGKIRPLSGMSQGVHRFPATTISSIFCDSNGQVWCGRPFGGILIIKPSSIDKFPVSEIRPRIVPEGFSAFLQDGGSDKIWLGTKGSGLLSFNPNTSTFTSYPSTAGLNIGDMCRLDSSALILTCPNKGVFIFNKYSGEISRIREIQSNFFGQNANGKEESIENDYQGRILIFSDHIARWNPKTDGLNSREVFPRDEERSGIYTPVGGARGEYITDDTHLYRWNELKPAKLDAIYEVTDGLKITASTMGGDDEIWFAAGDHLYCYKVSTGEIFCGSHIFSEGIMSLLCDNKGRIWIGTQIGLYIFDPVTKGVITLDRFDGISDDIYAPDAKLCSSDGDVYFGGKEALVRIKSDYRVASGGNHEQTIVSGVSIDGRPIKNFNNLRVPYSHNLINISFFTKSNNILKSVLYRIHIDGPGNSTIDEETFTPFLELVHSQPGWYKVSVSTNGPDGIWTPMEQIYSFKILYPWYLRWWAFLLYAVVAYALISLINSQKIRKRDSDRLAETDKERYNFLVNVSHELRTPLTLITGPLSRVLKNDYLEPEDKKSIIKANQQADKMVILLNTVRMMNDIEEGRLKIRKAPSKMNAMLKHASDHYREEAAEHNMEIVLRLDPTIGNVMMDENLCRCVFDNMMINSIKHNAEGCHVTVWSGWNSDSSAVRVGVRNHGNGIGDVSLSSLFLNYYDNTEEKAGFGIGLVYAKSLIYAQGGDFGAYNNNDDRGSTFWFELPADGSSRRTEDQINSQLDKLTSQIEAKKLEDKTILFVDSDADLRNFIKEELSEYCKEVLTAPNVQTAMDLLGDNTVHAILCDFSPDSYGNSLTDTVRATPHLKHIPIIPAMKPFTVEDILRLLDNKV